MEIKEDRGLGPFISAYHVGAISVDEIQYRHSILVQPEQPVVTWVPQSFAELNLALLEELLIYKPDLILLGTGELQHFLELGWLKGFTQQGIGIDVMSTAAACRTYNILMAEGRRVLAALLL
jgi:uncharacterized protein